jgi:hypothetical protein
MEDVLFRCRAKLSIREGYRIRWSINWGLAPRGELRLTTNSLQFQDWIIPYDEIDDAVLLAITLGLAGTGYNLVVNSSGTIYHFQLRSTSLWRWKLDPFWMGETPFPLRREVGLVTL